MLKKLGWNSILRILWWYPFEPVVAEANLTIPVGAGDAAKQTPAVPAGFVVHLGPLIIILAVLIVRQSLSSRIGAGMFR